MEAESTNKSKRLSRSRSRSSSAESMNKKSVTKKSRRKSSSSSSDSGSSGGRRSRESSLEERRRLRREKRKTSRSSSRERFIQNRERSKHRLQSSYIPRRPYGRRGNFRSPPRQRFGYRRRYNNNARNWSPRKRFGGGRDNDRYRDDDRRDSRRYSPSRSRSRERRDSHSGDRDSRDHSPMERRELQKERKKSSERENVVADGEVLRGEPEQPVSTEGKIPLEFLPELLPKREPERNVEGNDTLNSEMLKQVDDKLTMPANDISEVLNIIDSTTPDLNFLKKHKKSKASDNSSSDDSSSSGRRKRKHKSKSRKKQKKEKKKKRKKEKKHESKTRSKKVAGEELKPKVKTSTNDAEELLKLITGPNEIKTPFGFPPPPAVSDLDLHRRDFQTISKADPYLWPLLGTNPEPGQLQEKNISEFRDLPENHGELELGRETRKRLRNN